MGVLRLPLTVVHQIRKLLPSEDIIYLGDTARVPYGTRGEETIKKFSEQDLKFLIHSGVKCVVIACHTASAVAAQYLIDKYPEIKIFEVISPTVSYVKTLSGTTAVLATRATVNSRAFSSKLNSTDISCPLFVPCIEEGENEGELIEILAKKYLGNKKFDNIVLGCTHYPIIENTLRKVVGEKTILVNPGVCVTEELENYLLQKNLNNSPDNGGALQLYVTDLNSRFLKVAEMFLGASVDSNIKKVELNENI